MSSSVILVLGLFLVRETGQAATVSSAAEAARRLDACVEDSALKDDFRPTPRCDDATFLRRVWLDLAGRVPPLAEAERLSKSDEPFERARVIERLLESPEFATYWGRMWAEYLLGQRPFDQPEFSGRKLQQFLRESLKANRRYNEIAAELITAEGAMDESGAVNFLLRYNAEPPQLAGAVSQKFLGVTLQCAECHDHPHAAWKQTDFWGLSAFFARLRRMNPATPQPNEQFAAVLERTRGEWLVVDKSGEADEQGNYPTRTVLPQLPGATRRAIAPARREALAAWLTAPENPYFASHFVNQTWSRLIGAPLVRTFDPTMGRSHNDGSGPAEPGHADDTLHAKILELLRADFVASGFDIRRLIAVITLSETYQRSCSSPADAASEAGVPDRPISGGPSVSVANSAGTNAQEGPSREEAWQRALARFARGRARPLSADQIHLSLGQAFGYFQDENDHRIAQLTGEDFTYDIPINSFGTTAQSLGRSLALFNGEHLRGAVDAAVQALLQIHGDAAGPAHIQRLFLCLLSRPATDEELDALLDLAGGDIPQRGLEDAVWVILNSAEFQTNH